jgi:hypothetical protein
MVGTPKKEKAGISRLLLFYYSLPSKTVFTFYSILYNSNFATILLH